MEGRVFQRLQQLADDERPGAWDETMLAASLTGRYHPAQDYDDWELDRAVAGLEQRLGVPGPELLRFAGVETAVASA